MLGWQKVTSFLARYFSGSNLVRRLHITPVTLQADSAAIYLFQPDNPLQAEESAALRKTLQEFFAEESLTVELDGQENWSLLLDPPVKLRTTPLNKVAGKNIQDYLPRGHNQDYWRQLLTKLQMLLYTHPINIARRQQGKSLINGIWLWS